MLLVRADLLICNRRKKKSIKACGQSYPADKATCGICAGSVWQTSQHLDNKKDIESCRISVEKDAQEPKTKAGGRRADEALFQFFQQEVKELHELEIQGELDVYYFDEAGVNLTPVIPYAWQQKNHRYELPSVRSQNLTILGFMNKESQCQSFLFEGAADSEIVIACMDDFAKQITKKTVVILDRASIHTSKRMQQRAKQWQKQGLYLQFLPAYCPELNCIEMLWKHVKYYWLDLSAYQNMTTLKEMLTEVLENIGSKYHINFA